MRILVIVVAPRRCVFFLSFSQLSHFDCKSFQWHSAWNEKCSFNCKNCQQIESKTHKNPVMEQSICCNFGAARFPGCVCRDQFTHIALDLHDDCWPVHRQYCSAEIIGGPMLLIQDNRDNNFINQMGYRLIVEKLNCHSGTVSLDHLAEWITAIGFLCARLLQSGPDLCHGATAIQHITHESNLMLRLPRLDDERKRLGLAFIIQIDSNTLDLPKLVDCPWYFALYSFVCIIYYMPDAWCAAL